MRFNLPYIKLSFLLLAVAVIAGCYKDKGNYDYVSIDEATIDTSGLATNYSIQRFDTLTIAPVVTYQGVKVNSAKPQFPELKFVWKMYPASSVRLNDERTLDSTVTLHKMLDQPEMAWEVLFTVVNTKTGVKAFAKFAVAIAPSLAEGWMVLYEKNGHSDVGLIVNDRIAKATVKEKVLYDLYAASNGAPLKGKPGSLITSTANFPTYLSLFIQTSEDVASVWPGTFERKATFSDTLFWTVPSVKTPAFITASEGRKEFVLNNNKLHKIDYLTIAPGRRAFDDGAAGTYGTLAPWVASSVHATLATVVYDQTNQRFLKLTSAGADIIPFTTKQAAKGPFDINNVGMQFLLSDVGRNYYQYSVMKQTSTGKYYLLAANFRVADTDSTLAKGKYDMSACPEIENINSITAGYLGEIFYYSAGSNKFYQFKYNTGVTENLWTAPGNEKITCIRLQRSYGTNPAQDVLYAPKNANKVLYIATYDEASGNGKVYEMLVDPSSGALNTGSVRVYEGFGKIKAMAWKPFI
ncbi:PKD-like family lipoprotein [Filimonas effusa]|uniref:PKD-like family protein n=1 Tax=Filimonas effusa TaxID=2508721 RepID=A0A4Q1D178_9BACT|nr:PKD-like family lipoprotein [Filimonas effusa]RXK81452.1 hypothetical protein ESB13_21210 [Filimonas effusa]